jgi:hypothetical protein
MQFKPGVPIVFVRYLLDREPRRNRKSGRRRLSIRIQKWEWTIRWHCNES